MPCLKWQGRQAFSRYQLFHSAISPTSISHFFSYCSLSAYESKKKKSSHKKNKVRLLVEPTSFSQKCCHFICPTLKLYLPLWVCCIQLICNGLIEKYFRIKCSFLTVSRNLAGLLGVKYLISQCILVTQINNEQIVKLSSTDKLYKSETLKQCFSVLNTILFVKNISLHFIIK